MSLEGGVPSTDHGLRISKSNVRSVKDRLESLRSQAKTRMVATRMLSCLFLPCSLPGAVCVILSTNIIHCSSNHTLICNCSTCQSMDEETREFCFTWQRANYPGDCFDICALACDPCVCCVRYSDNSNEMFLTAPERQKMYDLDYTVQKKKRLLDQTNLPPSRPNGRVFHTLLLDEIDAVLMDLEEEKNEIHKIITNVIASYYSTTDLFIDEPRQEHWVPSLY
jgi:hypothetical protein